METISSPEQNLFDWFWLVRKLNC